MNQVVAVLNAEGQIEELYATQEPALQHAQAVPGSYVTAFTVAERYTPPKKPSLMQRLKAKLKALIK